MHQRPRTPPASASAANNPRANPLRTNNPRFDDQDARASPAPSDLSLDAPRNSSEAARPSPMSRTSTDQSDRASSGNESLDKLNLVIQSFFGKAALMILQHRTSLSPAYSSSSKEKRINKWFNVEIDETNDLLQDLKVWKTCRVEERRPPVLVVETYLDAYSVKDSGSLILQDSAGHQWGVEDTMRSYIETNYPGDESRQNPRVVLERWRLVLGEQAKKLPSNLSSLLPGVYKNLVVQFRSVFAMLKLMPAWELTKKPRGLTSSQKIPKIKYRIYAEGSQPPPEGFELELALDDGRSPVTAHYPFGSIDSPAGPLTIEVTYRQKCDFRVEKSMESIYSSKFIGQDEDLFKPSLDKKELPQVRKELEQIAMQAPTYGSLSTFHTGNGPKISSSPITALRTAANLMEESPAKPPDHRVAQSSRPSLKQEGGGVQMARRTSVSFMPFKSPSLSASPMQMERLPSVGASALSALAEARKPSTGARTHARTSSAQSETPASISSSPRPSTSRYSSSFGHRRAKASLGKDDDLMEKQPDPSALAEEGVSSGSLNVDDDNISDFLEMLDSKKDLRSFRVEAVDASTRRTTAALSVYKKLKESNAALTESISSSMVLQRSSTSSSRQLASLPPMVAANSLSSSPGERVSPRTPHTPAIPSRLSANSIIAYNERERSPAQPPANDDERRSPGRPNRPSLSGTGAIDIPTSPRPHHPSYRRPSSVSQERRPVSLDDEAAEVSDPRQSVSLGYREDREKKGGIANPSPTSMEREQSRDGPGKRADAIGARAGSVGGAASGASQPAPPAGRPRSTRYSFTRQSRTSLEEEEPFLFAMSDLITGGPGRKSVEEERKPGEAKRQ